jgi:hypothetical protein
MPAMPAFTTVQHLVPTHGFEDSPELDILITLRGMGCFDPRPTKDRATQPRHRRSNRQIHQIALPEATIPDDSAHGRGHRGAHGPAG